MKDNLEPKAIETLEPDLKKLLGQIERRDGQFDEHEIQSEIIMAWKKFSSEKLPFEWLAEGMAFEFMESYSQKLDGWGEYFGPSMEFGSADGTTTRIPDIKLVTPEMVAYWETRAKETRNSVMAARYAGLVFDLSKLILGKQPAFEITEIYFENLIKIAENELQDHGRDVELKLERALYVAILMNQDQWLSTARDSILSYQAKIEREDAPGYWGLAYRLLLKNKKTKTTPEQEKKIVDRLESILLSLNLRHVDNDLMDPWLFEAAAYPLADNYKKKNERPSLDKVITSWGNAFEAACEKASPMLASAWYQHIYEIYILYGYKAKADAVAIKMRKVGLDVKSEMQTFSTSVEIPIDKMNEYVDQFINKDLETALVRIAMVFIPNRAKEQKELEELARKNPFSYTITQVIQDNKGRPVAIIDSLDQDPEGRLIHHVSQYSLAFQAVFLDVVLKKTIEKFNVDKDALINFVCKSSIISPERKDIIDRAIRAYFEEEYEVATHLLVPQIEEATRNLFELFGGNVLKQKTRGGGFYLKTLDELLREQIVINVLGENCSFYFRVLLTDQRGWNLRNDLCHGLLDHLGLPHANRILHVLLCLSLVRPKG